MSSSAPSGHRRAQTRLLNSKYWKWTLNLWRKPPSPPLGPTYLIFRSPSQQPRDRRGNLPPPEAATGSAENKSAKVHSEFSQATAPGVPSPLPPPSGAASIRAPPPHPLNPVCLDPIRAAFLLMSQTDEGTVMRLFW